MKKVYCDQDEIDLKKHYRQTGASQDGRWSSCSVSGPGSCLE